MKTLFNHCSAIFLTEIGVITPTYLKHGNHSINLIASLAATSKLNCWALKMQCSKLRMREGDVLPLG